MITSIENIGNKVMNSIGSLYSFLSFFILYVIHLFNYHNYGSRTFSTTINQIYYTSVTILPFFFIIAFVFGSILVGALIVIATEFGIEVQIGSLIVTFVLNELSPLFTAIFISLRSGTLIHKRLSHIDTTNDIGLTSNIILPRIIAGVFSSVSLSLIFAMIMISSGYIFTFFLMSMDLHTYKYLIFDAIEVNNIIILLIKGIVFGFIITIIAIHNGLKVAKKSISSRSSVINMIVHIFLALFFIEMLSLLFSQLL